MNQRQLLALVAVVTSAAALRAQPSCPSGRIVAEYGYEFISCVGCLGAKRVDGMEYTTFSGEPVLHNIRENGPGANKLRDNDRVVAVGGYPITSIQASILLTTWQRDPVDLTLRNGGVRHEHITAHPLCRSYREPRITMRAPAGARLGVAIGCDGCRVLARSNGKDRWVYMKPPVLVAVEPRGPAERAGLRASDTLILVDGFPIESAEAGNRIGDLQPGRSMQWTVRRNGISRTVTIVPEPDFPPRAVALLPSQLSDWIGGVKIEASGRSVRSTRDAKTGVITIRGDSLTVILRPPVRP